MVPLTQRLVKRRTRHRDPLQSLTVPPSYSDLCPSSDDDWETSTCPTSNSQSCRGKGSLAEFCHNHRLPQQHPSETHDKGHCPDGTLLSWLSECNSLDLIARAARPGSLIDANSYSKRSIYEVLDSSGQVISGLICKTGPGTVAEALKMQTVASRAGDDVMPTWRELPDQTMLVMERYPYDLFTVLSKEELYQRIAPLEVVLRVARLVEQLHLCGMVHRDIKPENIVVSQDMNDLRLIDFEYAELAQSLEKDRPYRGNPGTQRYAAPELHQDKPFTAAGLKAADVFAFGVTAHAILRRLLLDHNKLPSPPVSELEPFALVADTVAHDPTCRPSMTTIIHRLEQAKQVCSQTLVLVPSCEVYTCRTPPICFSKPGKLPEEETPLCRCSTQKRKNPETKAQPDEVRPSKRQLRSCGSLTEQLAKLRVNSGGAALLAAQ